MALFQTILFAFIFSGISALDQDSASESAQTQVVEIADILPSGSQVITSNIVTSTSIAVFEMLNATSTAKTSQRIALQSQSSKSSWVSSSLLTLLMVTFVQ
eukprot:NODE_39_length_29903_cov_0.529057.p21 type:complete len:101 gc:universal NODE_39_length_29903_cov_0.529057:5157-5459(+)